MISAQAASAELTYGARERVAQQLDLRIDVRGAPLDETVGVEHEQRTRREAQLGTPALAGTGHPDRHVDVHRHRVAGPAARGEDRRQVPGRRRDHVT